MRCICGHPGAEYFALGGVLTFDVMLWRDARRVPHHGGVGRWPRPSWLLPLSS